METGGNKTTAGVVYWTPAPQRISPSSSLGYEEDWEDEDEEVSAEKEEDFQSQMDENGIIGLREALEDMEFDEVDVNGGCEPPWSAGGHSPGDGSPGEEDGPSMPLERATFDPNDLQDSETLSHTEPLGDDTLTHSLYDDVAGGMEVWTEDEELRQMQEEEERRILIHRQSMEHLPERDKQLDMTEEENDGDERQEETSKKDKHTRISGSSTNELESSNGFTERSFDSSNSWRFSSRGSSPSDQLNSEAIGPIRQNRKSKSRKAIAPQSGNRSTSEAPSPPRASTLPHLLHFSADELAEAEGIEAELFPDAGFTESLPESCSSRVSHAATPHWPHEHEPEAGSAAVSPELGMACHQNMAGRGPAGGFEKSNVKNCKRPTPSPRKARQRSSEATPSRIPSPVKAWVTSTEAKPHTSPDRGLTTPIRTQISTPDLYDARRGPLNYRTPDFSKVEPKVHFPKSGYTPPKSRNSPEKRSLPLERPLVFKSPADIVKEVLFSSPDDEPQPPDVTGAPDSTVPHDFRCPQQATTLVQQLQEDYNRLLTKFAEAENTIDRLRLEAKVNLYSDPPKPSHLVQSGLIQEGSKVMTLNIPLAQRAEFGPSQLAGLSPARPSSANSTSSRRSLASQAGQHPTRTLIKQADSFLQKVQAFEDLLKSGKRKPFEQMTHLSQLFEGLKSLERGYLAARDEHRLLRCRGAEMVPFDPNRELEGFIFQCGMRVEDFKEQLEQVGQDQPVSQAPPSPPPRPTPLSTPTTAREPMPQPETPVRPMPGEAGVVGVEVSSASGESDGEDGGMVGDDFFLRPLDRENRLAGQDHDTLFDHNQSFKELSQIPDQNLREGVTVSPGFGADVQQTGAGREEQQQRTGDVEDHSLRPARSRLQGSCKVPSPKPRTSKSNPPSPRANNQSPAFPAQMSNGRRRSEVRKSHSSSLTSLGESIVSERRGSKLQPRTRRVLSQDGIISPETDSGFVGSEASRLTPAAVPSPLHQRGSASASIPLERNPGNHQGGAPASGQPPPISPSSSSSSHRPPSSVHSDGSQLSAAGESQGPAGNRAAGERERRRTSASSSCRNWAGQTRLHRAGSGTSEFGLDSESTHSVSEDDVSYRPPPSPAAPYHHGDHLRVLGSGQLTSSNEAVRNLQTEVIKLKDRLDSLRTMATAPVTPPPAQRHYTHHGTSTPRIRSGQQCVDGGGEERRGRRMVEEPEGERTLRQTSKKRSASVPRQRQEPHTPAYSELDHSTPQSQFPRPFFVSADVQGPCSHYNTLRRSRAQHRRHPGFSAAVTEPVDEPDRRGSACPQCATHHHEHSARPLGGNSTPVHTSSHSRCCPLCGQPEPYNNTSTEPACRSERESDPTHRGCQSSRSTDRNARGAYVPVPGPPVLGSVPMVQCVPVCPATVLFYPSPVIKMDSYPEALRVPSNSSGGAPSGVRGRKEARGRTGSLTPNRRRSLSTSLDRAIRAARDMKHTSRHMARSLASGLHYQELLSQSCIY